VPTLIELGGGVPIESATTVGSRLLKGRSKEVKLRGDGPTIQIVICLFIIGVSISFITQVEVFRTDFIKVQRY
jgi:hypothetical protein